MRLTPLHLTDRFDQRRRRFWGRRVRASVLPGQQDFGQWGITRYPPSIQVWAEARVNCRCRFVQPTFATDGLVLWFPGPIHEEFTVFPDFTFVLVQQYQREGYRRGVYSLFRLNSVLICGGVRARRSWIREKRLTGITYLVLPLGCIVLALRRQPSTSSSTIWPGVVMPPLRSLPGSAVAVPQ